MSEEEKHAGIAPNIEACLREMRENDNGDTFELCPRCRCCELVTEDCENCGGEWLDGHECGEDCCCCADPKENVPCDICQGKGYFRTCLGRCDNGKHAGAALRKAEDAK